MRWLHLLLLGSLFVVSVTAQTSDGSQPLDIREGLWQFTETSHIVPNPGDIDPLLKGLPPDQRARALASLKAAYEKGTVQKRTVSLKRDNLIKGTVLTPDAACPKEITSSRLTLEVHFKCEQLDLVTKVERIDAENFTGSLQQTIKVTPPNIVKRTVVAKWIGEAPEKAVPQKPAGEQLITARIDRLGNDYYSVVTNHSGAAMTGYAISIVMYGSGGRTRHFYDLRMLNRPPIKGGGSVKEALRGIIVGATPLVAVFADGTTFGAPAEVADLMSRRNARLNGLTEMVSVLCNAQQKGIDKQTAAATLEKTKTRLSEVGSPMLATIQIDVLTEAIEKLNRPAPSRPISIQEVLQSVGPLGLPLLEDPVKDASGAPYIKTTAAQLSCSR